MSGQQRAKSFDTSPIQITRPTHEPNTALQFRGRELRTPTELIPIYRFRNLRAAREWCHRHVPIYKRGRSVLVDLRDVDAVLRKRA